MGQNIFFKYDLIISKCGRIIGEFGRIIDKCGRISDFWKINVPFTRLTWFGRILANFTYFLNFLKIDGIGHLRIFAPCEFSNTGDEAEMGEDEMVWVLQGILVL
jgi:hypothetical protein